MQSTSPRPNTPTRGLRRVRTAVRRGAWALAAAWIMCVIAGAGPAAAATCDAACEQAGAQAYIEALVSHDASAVPFATHAVRIENGLPTGTSGAGIRQDLNTSIKYRVILGEHDVQLSVANDVVSSTYVLDTGINGIQLATAAVKEKFYFCDGEIYLITATFDIKLGLKGTG